MAYSKICPVCLNPFTTNREKAITCCWDCSRKWKSLKATEKRGGVPKKNRTTDTVEIIYNRYCHDCGRPENNYRCPACYKKWLSRNHVDLD